MKLPDPKFQIHFEEGRHLYWIKSIHGWMPAPGTTAVLEDNGLMDWPNLPYEDLDRCREFGSAVHSAIEWDIQGLFDPDESGIDIAGCVEGARLCIKEHGIEIIGAEVLAGSNLGVLFASQVDLICKYDGVLSIIDWKTGAPYPHHGLGLAAHKEGMRVTYGLNIIRRYTCYLTVHGTYKVREWEDPSDLSSFLSAVQLFNWRRRAGIKPPLPEFKE